MPQSAATTALLQFEGPRVLRLAARIRSTAVTNVLQLYRWAGANAEGAAANAGTEAIQNAVTHVAFPAGAEAGWLAHPGSWLTEATASA